MHLIMVSFDAVSDGDLDILLEQPNLARLCRDGALMRQVDSVFVSNTYPAHVSIITGCLPARHGIVSNTRTEPGARWPDWRCDAREIQVPTLYQKAAEAGLSTCSVHFPVTYGTKSIRWHIPQIPGHMSFFRRILKMLHGNSPLFAMRSLLSALPSFRSFTVASLDDMTTRIACCSQRDYGPDLTLLHLLDVDDAKHRFGPQSDEARQALLRHDKRLGRILAAAERTYARGDWGVIVFSDHGCQPVHSSLDPNELLRRHGLIRGRGAMAQHDAFFHNAGGTTFLTVLNERRRDEIWRAVAELESDASVARRIDDEEMARAGLKPQFACGFEAAKGYSFGEWHPGQHGYSLRQESYHAFYAAFGPGLPPGKAGSGGCITDICPLAARLLGLPIWDMDGTERLP